METSVRQAAGSAEAENVLVIGACRAVWNVQHTLAGLSRWLGEM